MRDRINSLGRRLPTAAVYMTGAIPAVLLFYSAASGALGPDPVRALETGLGLWGLRFLLASLAITPLMWLGVRLMKFRRALGLLGFIYIALHFLTWIGLDMAFRWTEVLTDLTKRPYIVIGAIGLLLLVPLAATSWNGAIRRLGPLWKKLHRLAYPAILAGALHFVMIGKVWTMESLIYLGLALGLLGLRLGRFRQKVPSPA